MRLSALSSVAVGHVPSSRVSVPAGVSVCTGVS